MVDYPLFAKHGISNRNGARLRWHGPNLLAASAATIKLSLWIAANPQSATATDRRHRPKMPSQLALRGRIREGLSKQR